MEERVVKKMDYQNVKGTQDYLPEAEMIRRKIRRTLEDTFIQYGCKPLETPILNYTSLLASKYAGGAEILEEMYTLSDRGERDLSLRYDLTIPFAKVAAMNPAIKLPFKRYEIGKVFRDGPIKAGRFREFTQCDVDVVGVKSQAAEAEMMVMALNIFKKLKLDVTIQYNNRNLLAGMLKKFGTPEDKRNEVILVLDKLEKKGIEAVIEELNEKGISEETIEKIKTFIKEAKDLTFYLEEENEEIKKGLTELKELQEFLEILGVERKCEFNPFLARGLDIYTGTIYEVFLENKEIKSSIGSGGRYDNIIGGLLENGKTFSTVGISFGLDVIYSAFEVTGITNEAESDIDYYVIPVNTLKESFQVAQKLRDEGHTVELEMNNKKLGKALDRANKEKVKYVVIVGEEEVDSNQIKVRNMKTGEEEVRKYIF
jgi:histidyl-tRNA synthetase